MHAARMRGMSLIELMVAITLAAVLLTLALPSFRTAMENRQIRSAADGIHNGLQFARTEALRRNRTVLFELRPGGGWRVGCAVPDPTIVDGEEVCPATMQQRDSLEGSPNAAVETAEVGAGGPVATPVFDGDIEFTALGRVTAATLGAGNTAQFNIGNPTGGACAADGGEMRCLTVTVTSAGQTRTCDPAMGVATDPRAC